MEEIEKNEETADFVPTVNGASGRVRRYLRAPRPGYYYLFALASAIFTAEFTLMLTLAILPPLPKLLVMVLDPLILITTLAPALYFFLVRPLANEVTERTKAEAMLRESEKKYRDLVNQAQEGIWVIDRDAYTTFVNPRMSQMLGYEPQELQGRRIFEFMPGNSIELFKNKIERGTHGTQEQHDFEFLHRDGTHLYTELQTTPLAGEGGGYAGAIAGVVDMTGRHRLEGELQKLATTDTLTQAYTRARFIDIFEMERARAKRFGTTMSLIVFDIDGFKQINDSHGHLTGDCVLKTAALLIKEHKRAVDHLARWGGDEFVILSAQTDLEHAHAQGERLRKIIDAHEFENAGKITISLGVAQFRAGDDIDSLMDRADKALYMAKSAGKNSVRAAV